MSYKLNEFALIGLGRSGTTMFQNMLNSHSHLYLSEECHWIRNLSKAGLEFHKFVEADDLAIKKIPDSSQWWQAVKNLNSTFIEPHPEKKCGLQFIGKSNLSQLDPLYKIYPNLPTIILVRDPRSLLKSLYKTGIGYPSAAEDLVNAIAKISIKTNKYIVIRYEDFFCETVLTIQKICEFLGVEYQESMRHSLSKIVSHGDVSATAQLALDAHDWQQNLSTEQLYAIKDLTTQVTQLGFNTFQEKVTLQSTQPLSQELLYSNQIEVDWNACSMQQDKHWVTASMSSLGIVAIQTSLKNLTIIHQNTEIHPQIILPNELIFDLRKNEFTKTPIKPHKNFKHVYSFLELFDTLKNKTIVIYSAGTETQDFLQRNPSIADLTVSAVIDKSPLNLTFKHLAFNFPLISLAQASLLQNVVVIIPSLKHAIQAKKDLLQQGISEENMWIVI